ncbi:MAG: hypothetical protein ACLQQ0_01265, partial [Limisphaerales bacterium]
VHNPSWLTPYFSCVLVALGLVIHFLSHLVPILTRRVAGPGTTAAPAGGAVPSGIRIRWNAGTPGKEKK